MQQRMRLCCLDRGRGPHITGAVGPRGGRGPAPGGGRPRASCPGELRGADRRLRGAARRAGTAGIAAVRRWGAAVPHAGPAAVQRPRPGQVGVGSRAMGAVRASVPPCVLRVPPPWLLLLSPRSCKMEPYGWLNLSRSTLYWPLRGDPPPKFRQLVA